jgi:hypothetical protein
LSFRASTQAFFDRDMQIRKRHVKPCRSGKFFFEGKALRLCNHQRARLTYWIAVGCSGDTNFTAAGCRVCSGFHDFNGSSASTTIIGQRAGG